MSESNQYEEHLNTAIEYLAVQGKTKAINMLEDCVIYDVKEHRSRISSSPRERGKTYLTKYSLAIVISLGVPVTKYSTYENAKLEDWYKSIIIALQAVFNDLQGTIFIEPKLKLVSNPKANAENLVAFSNNQYHYDVFMVMPFRNQLNSVYDNFIKPISDELAIAIKRGDDRGDNPSGAIMDKVNSYLRGCRIAIIDCTEVDGQVNGNVYYELGIADTLSCDVILISQTRLEDLPIDIRHREIFLYKDNSAGLTSLKSHLIKEIKHILDLST